MARAGQRRSRRRASAPSTGPTDPAALRLVPHEVPHDREGNRTNGVDALRALALALARGEEEWPDLVAFLGDQVYADETSRGDAEFIAARRDIDEPPGEEIKDYEEYAHLYRLAWSDAANRWLLSTRAQRMIFDDHDIRDDWNTSWTWHEEIEPHLVVARAAHGRAVVVLGLPAPRQPLARRSAPTTRSTPGARGSAGAPATPGRAE